MTDEEKELECFAKKATLTFTHTGEEKTLEITLKIIRMIMKITFIICLTKSLQNSCNEFQPLSETR